MLKEKIDILTLLFSKPDEFIKDRIIEGNMGEMLETAFPNFKWEDFSDAEFNKNAAEKIERDYLYLFIGVSNPLASPYASSYYRKESRLMDKPARDNIKLMKKWGLEMEEDYKDLPDHILTTLNIVSVLLEHRENVEEEVLKREISQDIYNTIKNMEWLNTFKENILEHEEAKVYSKFTDALIETFQEMKLSWENSQA